MFRIIFLFSILILSTKIFGQNKNFKIVNLGKSYSESTLIDAVNKADWCGYYHQNQRFIIKFDDDARIELFSKTEITNLNLSESCFQVEKTFDEATYKIHENGGIIRMVSARNTTKNKR